MRKKERKIERRKREIYRKGKEKEKEITEKETLEKWAKTVYCSSLSFSLNEIKRIL